MVLTEHLLIPLFYRVKKSWGFNGSDAQSWTGNRSVCVSFPWRGNKSEEIMGRHREREGERDHSKGWKQWGQLNTWGKSVKLWRRRVRPWKASEIVVFTRRMDVVEELETVPMERVRLLARRDGAVQWLLRRNNFWSTDLEVYTLRDKLSTIAAAVAGWGEMHRGISSFPKSTGVTSDAWLTKKMGGASTILWKAP